jgi:hypothetical protein
MQESDEADRRNGAGDRMYWFDVNVTGLVGGCGFQTS